MQRAHLFCVTLLLMSIAPAAAFACMHNTNFMTPILIAVASFVLGVSMTQTLISAGVWKLVERHYAVVIPRPKFWLLKLWGVALWGMSLSVAVAMLLGGLFTNLTIGPGLGITLVLTTPLVLHTAYAARAWNQRTEL